MKRTLAVLALTGSLAMLSGGAAMATTYPAPPPGVTVSDGTVAPGEEFTFSGTGFTPGEDVVVTVTDEGSGGGGGAVGTRSISLKIVMPAEVATFAAVADAEGKFDLPIELSEEGVYTITATGETSGRTQSTVVTVAAAEVSTTVTDNDTEAGGDLADTGADSNLLLWGGIGAVALIAGATSVVIVRRRSNVAETA